MPKRVKDMKRDQQKAVFWKMSQVKTRHAHRSPHAQAVDRHTPLSVRAIKKQ